MTCEEYAANVKAILDRFATASQTSDPVQWDAAFALFVKETNANEVAFGHPPFPPKKRP